MRHPPRRRARALLCAAASLVLAACGNEPTPARPVDTTATVDTVPPLSRLAFGSCSDEDQPQPLWDDVLAASPDLWVWLGDNIYGDTPDTAVLRAKYRRQDADTGYAALKAVLPIVGTWDDHDYGRNNGGKEFTAKAGSQHVTLDFLGEPAGSPRRARAGIYESYTYGPRGRRVKLILLDTRYHRDALPTYGQTSSGDVLGEEQWAWLERELTTGDAQVHLIASSIQVVPTQHRFEKWANFPQARDRLLELVATTRAPGVVFLSGDRHFAEISRLDDPRVGYPLYEITSSGMTHAWEQASEANRHRLGSLLREINFGTVSFDWSRTRVIVTAQVRDAANAVRLEQRFAAGQPPAP